MAFSTLVDLVKVASATTGQGALALGAAVPGYLSPSTVIPPMSSGSVVSYGISDPAGGNEVGQGILTLSSGVWTLTRGVTQSSNGGAPILCTGQATVALTLRAEDLAGVGAVSGTTHVSSGTITTPVSFLDISLPAGFASFQLRLSGFYINIKDSLAFGVSVNGGKTFINDTQNFDSYKTVGLSVNTSSAAIDSTPTEDGVLSLWAPQDTAAKIGSYGQIDIYPGSSSQLASFFATVSSRDVATRLSTVFFGRSVVNPAATIAPTPARINLLRFIAYGSSENLNPPDSGETLTAGSYTLLGLN